MKKHFAHPARPLAPLLTIALASLLLCLRMLTTPHVVGFQNPLEWGFINWAHRYPLLLEYFADAVRHGIAYPRWLPQLMAGNGYPTFVFYQPGLFFFSLPFALAFSPVLACKLAVFAMLLLGGMGALKLAQLHLPPLAATVAALLFLLNPYLIAGLYVRAAYSEVFGMMLCPWCLLELMRLHAGQRPFGPALRFALWLAALAVSHPFVLIYFSAFLLLLVPALWLQAGRPPQLIGVYAACAALALALAAPYWLPALELRHEVNYQGILFTYPGWYRPITELLSANAGATLLALAGLALHWRSPVAWATALYGAFLLFLNTPASAPLWQWRIINLTQLPYRSFSVDASLRLLGYIYAFRWLATQRPALQKWLVPATLLAVPALMILNPMARPPDAKPFSVQSFRQRLTDENHQEYLASSAIRYNDESLSYDFLPRAVNMASLSQEKPGSRPLAWAHSGTLSAAPAPESSAHHLRLNIDVVNAPATLQIRQLYLPGWQLRINGQPHPATPGDDGRLAAVLETPGAYTVEAWYEGPPGWGLRNAAIVLISMAALLLLRRLTTGGPA